ncbi:hypothetical protein ABH908_000498 [Pseudomonas frederiksbergensis]|uniref:hypothetical protein n=1 Tax=Pseudomonas frederiksbergensis TaxID=104087 RepID=UPI003D1DDAB6
MGWGCHPDTLKMASAHHRAKNITGEVGTLEYLRAYRDEYRKEVTKNPMRGGVEYIASIDAAIQQWEAGDRPDFSEISIPGMIGTRPSDKHIH